MEREFQAHLEEEIQEHMESGIPLEDATAAAHRIFGNKAQVMEEARTAWRWSAFESVVQDAKFALRTLTKTPSFTATAVLTLALGISANTAILSVINVVLVRPLPYKDFDRYVRIIENRPTTAIRSTPGGGFSAFATFERTSDLNSAYLPIIGGATRTLEHVAAYSDVYFLSKSTMTATGFDQPIRLAGKRVSHSLFSMLGVQPLLGRVFETHDRSMILSYKSWQRDFQGDRSILDRTLTLDDTAYSVVGVMPRDFDFPSHSVDFWIPLIPRDWTSDISAQASLIAKLKDGVTIQAAAAETAAIVENIGNREGFTVPPGFPTPKSTPAQANAPPRIELVRMKDEMSAPSRPALMVLGIAVGFVLLIACANIANLLMARTATRQREIAVRVALGAGRTRLIRQMLTESILLALTGGIVGTGLAYAAIRIVRRLGAGYIERIAAIHLDLSLLLFALGLSVLTGMLFGMAPALRGTATSMQSVREGAAAAASGLGLFQRYRLRSVLLVAQIAIAMVLLVGGGLLIRSFVNLITLDPGYDPKNLLTFQVALPRRGPMPVESSNGRVFVDELLQRLRALQGVQSVGATTGLPIEGNGGSFGGRMMMRGLPGLVCCEGLPRFSLVSQDYFRAMGMKVVDGHGFQENDPIHQPNVLALINRAMVRHYFKGESVIGRVLVQEAPRASYEIIGVVDDVHQAGLDSAPEPEIYLDMRHNPANPKSAGELGLSDINGGPYFAVRTTIDPNSIVPTVRAIVREVDPRAMIELGVATMDTRISNSTSRPHFYAVLLGAFAGIAALIAGIGIYGVIAYLVAQRTQEIGIRMALGAKRRAVLSLVLRQGLVLIVVGIILGLIGAAAVTRYLQSMLFGLTPLDPATFVLVSIVFGSIATVSCYVPARRATKIDPLVALRHE